MNVLPATGSHLQLKNKKVKFNQFNNLIYNPLRLQALKIKLINRQIIRYDSIEKVLLETEGEIVAARLRSFKPGGLCGQVK